jgi:hypothetical protein
MPWNIRRGRYSAKALTEEKIETRHFPTLNRKWQISPSRTT